MTRGDTLSVVLPGSVVISMSTGGRLPLGLTSEVTNGINGD